MDTDGLEAYADELFRAALRICGNWNDAEDLAQETLLAALEQACGSCDSLCEEYAHSDENAEAVLQTIPSELLARLRKRGLCLRQLARHLVKGDTVYEV